MEYQQFRIAARGLVVQNNALLLVSDNGKNWYLPGGRLECGESLPSCVEREVYEETGFLVKAGQLRYVLECLDRKDYTHKLHFYFQTEIIIANQTKDWEDSGGTVQFHRFFTLQEIRAEKSILPPFLAEGEWCSFTDTQSSSAFENSSSFSSLPIYQGTLKVRGFELIEDY